MKKVFILLAFSALTMFNAQEEKDLKYRRISLYSVMIDKPDLPYANEIKKDFQNSAIPEKFNDHNLGKRVYNLGELPSKDQNGNEAILNTIARDMVAKWFNRSEKGGFNMNLIKERGQYDASALDVSTAKSSQRGLDILADAGEELIGKTFVLINEFNYTNKEEIAKKANGWLTALGTVGDYAGISNASTVTSLVGAGATVAGKGYIVKTNAHLYQLIWDSATANKFYNELWADDNSITPEQKKAFDEATFFKLQYIGTDNSWADVQSSVFTSKSEEQLVEKATVKSVDNVIVKLQKNHDQFKTKTPLYTGEPISAKIGLKEGVNKKSVFDVLEQQIDGDGKTKYVEVGTVKVDTKYPIWDNQYGAAEENADKTTDRTYFKKVRGKDFFPGMLLVQRKGK